jgi:septum formation protein
MAARPRLILASSSPRRLQLLQQIGRAPDLVVAADVDERPRRGELPRAHALRLAIDKARAVAAQHPDAVVIAADTVVALGRRILPKAEDDAEVKRCLGLLSGRRHRVYGGICVVQGKRTWSRVVTTTVRFARLTEAAAAAYIASGEGRGKAGGYGIQGRAAEFVLAINGSYPNIVGLCVATVARLIDAAGSHG